MTERIDYILDSNIDRQTRTVWLTGPVDEEMYALVSKSLHIFRGKPVHFRLQSDGGAIDQGLAICDLISSHTGRTTITVEGNAESMAAVILQSANIRRMTKSSLIMIHQGILGVDEKHKRDVKQYIKIIDKQDAICDEIVVRRIQKKHPKYSWNKFRAETEHDVYFTSEQALAWGLVDHVI